MVQLTTIATIVVTLCILRIDACQKFTDGKFFRENSLKWTWQNASKACMADYIARDGPGRLFEGLYGLQKPPHALDFERLMIFKWYCLTECDKTYPTNPPWFMKLNAGIGHVDSESPTDTKMVCECVWVGPMETVTIQDVHNKWMAECYKGNAITTDDDRYYAGSGRRHRHGGQDKDLHVHVHRHHYHGKRSDSSSGSGSGSEETTEATSQSTTPIAA